MDSTYRKQLIAAVACFSLFIIGLFTIFILNTLNTPTVIHNSEEDSKLDSKIKLFGEHLKDTLSNLGYTMPDEINAVIREDSVKTYSPDGSDPVTATFLLDIDSPKLTYQVTLDYDTDNFLLVCPDISLVQDPNTFCIGTDKQSTIDANLAKYLPYSGETTSEISFTISRDYDSKNNPRLSVYANVCNDETIATEVETAVKEWIRDKGIPNPDIIPLHFPHSYCNDRE